MSKFNRIFKIAAVAGALVGALYAGAVFADTSTISMSTLSSNIAGTANNVGKIISGIADAIGVGLVALAIYHFKSMKDEQHATQGAAKKAILLLAAATFFLAGPFIPRIITGATLGSSTTYDNYQGDNMSAMLGGAGS